MMLRLALAVFVGVIIVIGTFAFFIPHANQGGEVAPIIVPETSHVPPLAFTHSFKKGVHTIKGAIEAPTPCTLLTASFEVASGTPDSIVVDLRMPLDTEICLQHITSLPFTGTASAAADARIQIRVNGEIASTTEKTL